MPSTTFLFCSKFCSICIIINNHELLRRIYALVVNYIKNEINMIECKLIFLNLAMTVLAVKYDYGKYSTQIYIIQ